MQRVTPSRMRAALATLIVLLSLSRTSWADGIISFSGTSTFNFSPSSDSFVLAAGTSTDDPQSGFYDMDLGSFVVGDSEIPDQVISFTMQDTFTLNGVTQTVDLYGQDAVTSAADVFTVYAGAPVAFGNETLSLQGFTYSADAMGTDPVTLTAAVTPEPGSILLLGTGLLAGALLYARHRYTRTGNLPLR